jgi:hypothetical protein
MSRKWTSVWGFLAIAFVCASCTVAAQDYRRGDRGNIQVTNDWEDTVRVTLWKERGGQMSERTWTIRPGQSALLAGERGRSLWVRGSDLINLGNEWGQVPIGTVGTLQGGMWYVRVRDVWRATHREGRGRSGGLPPDQPGTRVPYYGR